MTALTDTTVLRCAPALACAYQERSAVLRAGGRILRYDGDATLVLRHLLPLLDGQRPLEAVIGALGGERLRPAVLHLCDRLVADGLLVDAASREPTGAPGELFTDAPPAAGGAISTMRVVGTPDEVAAITELAPEHWQVQPATLAEISGEATPGGVCTTVWLTDPNDAELAEWNESAYHNRQPWLPISHFDGEVAVVGPYVHPRQTPCFECYRRRRAARHPLGEEYLRLRPLDRAPLASKALRRVLAGIAVTLLRDWETRANPYLPGALRTVNFDQGLEVDSELVLRVPRCPACRPGASIARPTLWSEYFALAEPE